MTLLDWLHLLLLALVVVDWVATAILWRLHRERPENTALASRTLTSTVLSVAGTVSGLLAVAQLMRLSIPGEATTAGVVAVFVLVSVPQAHWLWLYWRGHWS